MEGEQRLPQSLVAALRAAGFYRMVISRLYHATGRRAV
jgi:hypothetical protein